MVLLDLKQVEWMDRCFGVSMTHKRKKFSLVFAAFLLILTGNIKVGPFKIPLLLSLHLISHTRDPGYPGICEIKCKEMTYRVKGIRMM